MHTITLADNEAQLDIVMQQVLDANKMKLVSFIDGQQKAAMIGRDVSCERIYEVFRPDYACKVWAACPEAGIDIPLRFHIFRNAAGILQMNYRMPGEVFSHWQSEALNELADTELDPLFEALVVDFAALLNSQR